MVLLLVLVLFLLVAWTYMKIVRQVADEMSVDGDSTLAAMPPVQSFTPSWARAGLTDNDNKFAPVDSIHKLVSSSSGLEDISKVLDIGSGLNTAPIRAAVKTMGIQIVSSSLNPSAIRVFKKETGSGAFITEREYPRVASKDRHFELVYDWESASLMTADREQAMREAFRVLKKGGWFITSQYCLLPTANTSKQDSLIDGLQRYIHTPSIATNSDKKSSYSIDDLQGLKKQISKIGFEIRGSFDCYNKAALSQPESTSVYAMNAAFWFGNVLISIVAEMMKIVPKGSAKSIYIERQDQHPINTILRSAAEAKVISPAMIVVCQKPL